MRQAKHTLRIEHIAKILLRFVTAVNGIYHSGKSPLYFRADKTGIGYVFGISGLFTVGIEKLFLENFAVYLVNVGLQHKR